MGLLRYAVLATCILLSDAAAAQSPKTACARHLATIDAAAAKTLAQGSPGMLIRAAQRGRPILARAYGIADLEQQAPLAHSSVFKLASVTKQFTAAAVLLLAADGKLSLEDPLARYVPELPYSEKVSLYQLLVQTSGIPDYAEDPVGGRSKSVAKTPAEMLNWIVRLSPELRFEPGTKWEYSNSNYVLLGIVAERTSGKPLEQLFAERLFKPAGMNSTAFDDPADIVPQRVRGYRRSKTDPSGFANADWISPTVPWAAGGWRTTGEDLIRWSSALFGGRILKPGDLRRMTEPGRLNDRRTTKSGMPEAWQKGLNSDYGMGVFVTPSAHGTRIWHGGDIDGFSTWLGHYPASSVTIALMINSQSADMDKEAIAAAVFAMVADRCA